MQDMLKENRSAPRKHHLMAHSGLEYDVIQDDRPTVFGFHP